MHQSQRRLSTGIFAAIMAGALTGAASFSALAQTWPARPVRVVVPFAPGGSSDIVGRQVSSRLSAELKQQFVVDNRGGAGGLLGIENVARSAPDGYSLLVTSASYSASLATSKSGPELIDNMVAVSQIGYSPFVLVVNPASPYKSTAELIAAARAKPGAVVYASSGPGSSTHLGFELFSHMAKIKMLHVPYKGAGPSINDLIAGRVEMTFAAHSTIEGNLKAGKLRALAVTNAKRAPALPNVPTIGETVPGYSLELWFGMIAPKGTPEPAVNLLNAAINRIASSPDSRKSMETIGIIAEAGTAKAFDDLVRTEYQRYLNVIKEANIQPE